jgi:L,D-peptidoglycan transpeptidase YkuD (ErfK/YbiS/YcfS/YnhG family)
VDTYENAGFIKIGETLPSFWWVSLQKIKRYNRQQFKATKDKSEEEVAEENKVYKIHGCNNSIFLLTF